MTTIAYRGGVLASDTQMTDGNIKSSGRKLHYVKDKAAWVGVAGAVCDCQKFLRWFADVAEEDEEFDEDEDDFVALVMYDDGKVECWTADLKKDVLEVGEFYAIGSGGPAALAAMHMGADARKAVETAARVDLNTGGDVAIAKRTSRRMQRFRVRPAAAHRRG